MTSLVSPEQHTSTRMPKSCIWLPTHEDCVHSHTGKPTRNIGEAKTPFLLQKRIIADSKRYYGSLTVSRMASPTRRQRLMNHMFAHHDLGFKCNFVLCLTAAAIQAVDKASAEGQAI